MLHLHGFIWKGYNFHWLKDIFCGYTIKHMKKLLSWLLYPIGCGPTTKIVYILQIYMTWNSDKHKIWYSAFVNFIAVQTQYSCKLSFFIKAGHGNLGYFHMQMKKTFLKFSPKPNALKHWKHSRLKTVPPVI